MVLGGKFEESMVEEKKKCGKGLLKEKRPKEKRSQERIIGGSGNRTKRPWGSTVDVLGKIH
jgi:hypothetical protein